MKLKLLSFLVICKALMICQIQTGPLRGQHLTDHQYTITDSIFNNPERGFYKYTSRGSAAESLSKSSLETIYNGGFTLIYRIYYMQDYVDKPIGEEYLSRIREDFQVIRESGIKVVLRFAYTSNSEPPYGDATPEQVQEHIAQLKPILQENSDVIAVLQAGFIGAWGEWYYTDYFATGSPDNITVEDLEERSDLVYSLLDALPSSRQIQLRYVGYKRDFFGEVPISPAESYSGNAKSRMAHHNDCFLSSSNDVGTYHSASDRTYLASDSKYTSVGGETCRWYEPRSNCDTALVEMARYHWSFINIDYFGTTIQNWKDDGCFDDIQRKLGYRYQLLSSSIQDSSRQGGSFHATVQITNTGFSNPYNPRMVELVLRNKNTKKEYFLELKTDIRKNTLGETVLLDFEGGIPSEAVNGEYDLFLNLPDPTISIRNDPRYSIRIANENTWEASTGYNRLFHTVIINPGSSAPDYTGTDYFLNSEQRNHPVYEKILVDGMDDDWTGIAPAGQSDENLHLKSVKIYNDSHYLYFLAKGDALYPGSRLFIDADNDPLTGMNHQVWQANGINYLVENSSLYSYSGLDGSSAWSWLLIGQINTLTNDSLSEIAVPLNLIGNPVDSIRYGFINGNTGFGVTEKIPSQNDPLFVYRIDGLIDNAPEILATQYSNNAILFWGKRLNDNKSRIIERSEGGSENFKVMSILSPDIITYKDNNLSPGVTYAYRSFLTNFRTVTPYTPAISVLPDSEVFRFSEIIADGSTDDWDAISPVLSLFDNFTYTLRSFADTKNLNFLISGNNISGFKLFLETDDAPLTGTSVPEWTTDGIDYKISHDSLFSFQQEWIYKSTLSRYVFTDSVIELSIPFSEIFLNNQTSIRAGISLNTGSGMLMMPFIGQSLAVYNRILPAGAPTGFQLVSSSTDPASKIILRWNKCTNCTGNVIQKLYTDPDTFKLLIEMDNKAYQYIDDSLDNHMYYSYRMYSYNPAGRSDYTKTLTGFTHDVGIPEQDADMRFRVFMDQSAYSLVIQINDPDLVPTSVFLYDFSGKKVLSAKPVDNKQELNIPLGQINPGIYLLNLIYPDGQYAKKVIIY